VSITFKENTAHSQRTDYLWFLRTVSDVKAIFLARKRAEINGSYVKRGLVLAERDTSISVLASCSQHEDDCQRSAL